MNEAIKPVPGAPMAVSELRCRYAVYFDLIQNSRPDLGCVFVFEPDKDISNAFLFPHIEVIYTDWGKPVGRIIQTDGSMFFMNSEHLDTLVQNWNLNAIAEQFKSVCVQERNE